VRRYRRSLSNLVGGFVAEREGYGEGFTNPCRAAGAGVLLDRDAGDHYGTTPLGSNG
jgi:hypothetical protein